LVEEVEGDGGHAALVGFARAVDVEVAEPGDLRRALVEHAPHRLVEQELRVAVDVERPLVLARLLEDAARSVHRGRRRVDARHALLLAPREEVQRVLVVVLHHVAPVGLHGVGAGALVQDRAHAVEVAGAQPRDQVELVDVIGDLAVGDVRHLLGALQVVDGDDVGLAARVERLDEVRADEAGGAGDDERHRSASSRLAASSSGCTTAVPSLPTTMPAAWLAAFIASCRFAPAAIINASTPMTVSPAPLTSNTSRA